MYTHNSLPKPGFELRSTAGEFSVPTARLHNHVIHAIPNLCSGNFKQVLRSAHYRNKDRKYRK